MLSTDIPTVAFVLTAIGLVIAIIWSIRRQFACQEYCESCMEYIQAQNKTSISLKKMADVEIALTELTDSYENLLKSHKKLRARIGMRASREAKSNGNGLDMDPVPVDDAQKAMYKARLRADLKKRGLL